MNKQEMTYWQHLKTMNSIRNEGLRTLTDQSSKEEILSETCVCNHSLVDK